MNNRDDGATRATLVGRLCQQPGNEQAWEEFVHLYGPRIDQWCRHWGVQPADTQDITQQVLLKLVQKLPQFNYDPSKSFRAWLKTVVHHAWQDAVRRRKPGVAGSGDTAALQMLESVEARDDLTERLQDGFDHELLQEALARTRLRVAPNTWRAFELTALEGLPAKQVAAQIPMNVAQVYVARRRVQQSVQQELQRLDTMPAHDPPSDSRPVE